MQAYRAALRARTSVQSTRSTFVPSVSRVTQVRLATQDYGSGAGNPAGEDPEAQGGQPSSDIEHPGPAPPDVGQKNAGAKTHGDSPTSSSGQATPSNPQSSSSSSGSKEGETPSSSDTTGRTQSKNSASPKFNTVPENQDTEDVKKHNEDVDRRRESSNAGEKDQEVKKGTYSGQGGIAQGTGDGPK